MPRDTAQLFAIVRDGSIRNLPLRQGLQGEVWDLFANQEQALRAPEIEVLEFDPGLRPDEEHVIRIPDFVLPVSVREAIEHPLTVEPLGLDNALLERVTGLFMGDTVPRIRIWFQVFDRRQLLRRTGFSLILSQGIFRLLEEPGVTLDASLAAVVVDDQLYFRSFARAKRVVDLTGYYREATDRELDDFAGHEGVHCEDLDALRQVADTWVRRKVAALLANNVLQTITARRAANVARDFGLTLGVRRIDGHERLVLPVSRAELKDVLRFLDEDYYQAPLTQTQYISHSKRRLQR